MKAQLSWMTLKATQHALATQSVQEVSILAGLKKLSIDENLIQSKLGFPRQTWPVNGVQF